MTLTTIVVSTEVEVALKALQEAVTVRETALNLSKTANERLRAQREALEIRAEERERAEVFLDQMQGVVEDAQRALVKALGGRVTDPETGDLI